MEDGGSRWRGKKNKEYETKRSLRERAKLERTPEAESTVRSRANPAKELSLKG